MTPLVLTVFVLVYLGMILGGLPFLKLDRTGVALLGAIALIATEAVSEEAARAAIHAPTLILLFSFMVVSAQLRLGGFYDWAARRLGTLPVRPPVLLGALIAVAAGLSAVFSNDIVCLAMAPVLADLCIARRLDPVPFLLGLACAANVGSAATLIGNPQNMLPVRPLAAGPDGARRRRSAADEPSAAFAPDAGAGGLGTAGPLHGALRRQSGPAGNWPPGPGSSRARHGRARPAGPRSPVYRQRLTQQPGLERARGHAPAAGGGHPAAGRDPARTLQHARGQPSRAIAQR